MKKVAALVTMLLLILLWPGSRFLLVTAQDSKRAERHTLILDEPPVRTIQDESPSFYGITMDVDRGEVFVSNDNQGAILVYGSEFRPTEKVVEPRRQIAGPRTHLRSVCSLAISPEHNEIFAADNDISENVTVYPLEGKGDVAPLRELIVDRGVWGVFLDPKHDEEFVTVEHTNKVSVFPRTADGRQKPLRSIQGPNTGLADPHGIFVDPDNNELFVANHGHWRETKPGESWTDSQGFDRGAKSSLAGSGSSRPLTPSTGKFFPPSITVYSRDANGDAKPLRTIQGPRTGLNWPLGIYLDPVSHQLAVANSGSNAILFFDANASGDVAPVRVIQGPATGMDGPSGVFVDGKRNELWVTNWNNRSATIYDSKAQGDIAPLRTLRGAPKGISVAGLAGPGAIAYDPKRKEMLVPN